MHVTRVRLAANVLSGRKDLRRRHLLITQRLAQNIQKKQRSAEVAEAALLDAASFSIGPQNPDSDL